MKRQRIDKLLVEIGLADSIEKARALVMAGAVLANEQRVEKPAQQFARETTIRIKGNAAENRFVGRGGLKLQRALNAFKLNVNELVCLDIGASTGGFTDCLLQNGARKVYAIDAGRNQIDWKLRQDARVEVREKVNARYLTIADFTEDFDLIVMDVSFISIIKLFPAVVPLLKETGRMIALLKPQFEVKRGEVEPGGIVRDPEKHQRVIREVNQAAQNNNLIWKGTIDSPILGADGNKEFLTLYQNKLN